MANLMGCIRHHKWQLKNFGKEKQQQLNIYVPVPQSYPHLLQSHLFQQVYSK